MEVVAVVVMFACIFGIAYCALMLKHNERAFKYQMAVLNCVSRLNDSKISELRALVGDPRFWSVAERIGAEMAAAWLAIDKVDGNDLRRYWWRPFRSFYGELAPLLPDGLPPEPE